MYVKPTIGTKRHLCRGVACHFLHTVEQAIFDFFTVFFRQELAVRQKLNAYFLLPLFLDYMGMGVPTLDIGGIDAFCLVQSRFNRAKPFQPVPQTMLATLVLRI